MSVLETRHVLDPLRRVSRPRTDVSIAVGEWEIVGIIGPNGAGKTTTFNIITGFYTPDAGRVSFKGHDVTGLAVHERAALGLGRTFQNVGLVKGSTVRENLRHRAVPRGRLRDLAGHARRAAARSPPSGELNARAEAHRRPPRPRRPPRHPRRRACPTAC